MNDAPLPWYVALLGHPPDGELFHRLVAEFELSSEEDPGAVTGWFENPGGVSVAIRDSVVQAIQFFSSENPNFAGFARPLPLGLSFTMTRNEILARLGDPDDVRPPHSGTIPHSGIDRYETEACTVMIVYSARSGRLEVLGFERSRTAS